MSDLSQGQMASANYRNAAYAQKLTNVCLPTVPNCVATYGFEMSFVPTAVRQGEANKNDNGILGTCQFAPNVFVT